MFRNSEAQQHHSYSNSHMFTNNNLFIVCCDVFMICLFTYCLVFTLAYMDCCRRKSKNLEHAKNEGSGDTAQEVIERQTNRFQENIRVPTDVIFLVIFVIFIVLSAIVGVYAFAEGHPERLLNGIDSEGRVCGHDPGVESKHFLYYFDLTSCAQLYRVYDPVSGFDLSELFSCPTPQVCRILSPQI